MFLVIFYNPILKKNESMQIEANNKMDARLKFVSMWTLPLKIIRIKEVFYP